MILCKKCGSHSIVAHGHNRAGKRRHLCKDCGTQFVEGDDRRSNAQADRETAAADQQWELNREKERADQNGERAAKEKARADAAEAEATRLAKQLNQATAAAAHLQEELNREKERADREQARADAAPSARLVYSILGFFAAALVGLGLYLILDGRPSPPIQTPNPPLAERRTDAKPKPNNRLTVKAKQTKKTTPETDIEKGDAAPPEIE